MAAALDLRQADQGSDPSLALTAPSPELPAGQPTRGVAVVVARAANRVRADFLLVGLDLALTVGCYLAALAIRFDGRVPQRYWAEFPALVALALAAHLGANWTFGLYGQMWRHASVAEGRRLVLAGAVATTVVVTASLLTSRQPLSVLLMGGGTAMMLSGAIRFRARLFAFGRVSDDRAGLRIVLVGAGESGAAIVREMQRNPGAGLRPVAVVDDNARVHGRYLAGVPVVGAIEQLPEAVRRFDGHQVLLAIPSADSALVQRVADLAEKAEVAMKLTPTVRDLLGGPVSIRDVRELRIEDLLGRAEVETNLDSVRSLLRDRRVLVTGAGGSIGSEIARQVALCHPAELVMLDHDETHLFEVAATLDGGVRQVLADIRNPVALRKVMARHRPQVVFHAAAHKHVPLLEDHPCEAIATNVVGTANLLATLDDGELERFVFISTDKAVRPTSVMGATKWLGEQLVTGRSSADARYCAVRFGNVLGSRGSVIPTFARQIAGGGPVTVTDQEMTRFFMSVQEAVQLVLQAACLAEGGEVFMLEMGQPVNIMNLAQRMIRLSGRNVDSDIGVVITGARPGEKLSESLQAPDEVSHPTEHPAILRLETPRLAPAALASGVDTLARMAEHRHDHAASRALFELVDANDPDPPARTPLADPAVGQRLDDGAPAAAIGSPQGSMAFAAGLDPGTAERRRS